MSKKNETGYLSAKESRRISRENRRITDQLEKRHKRKNVPESEYLTQMKDPNNALEIENLHTYFFSDVGTVRAVDGVSFDVPIGKTVGVVGESGCGKSVTSLSIMQLLQRPQGQIVDGEIRLNLGNGKCYDITKTPTERMQNLRGNYMSMIFQEPMNSLNPVFTVGNQLVETLLRHEDMTRRDAWDKSVDMLKAVGIPSPEKRMHDYSFQMSGGMRQRVMIAMSLCLDPDILIADEPTTALDVTVQAQILDLLREMQDRVGASIIMITHDLGVVAEVSDKVAVMYAGRKVEEGSVEQILFNPQHPYTKALKGCIPHLQRTPTSGRHRLHEIPGMVLGMAELGKDRCSFYERCPCGKPECMEHNPPAKAIDAGHEVACWLYS